ncbi:hypothetical protein SmJEL517_g03321 [Synchytrium microbalum]|uniref:Transmembrane protein n=1 Tax=Synchytrium microbalum TaxID=1806994 RepID=A0A507BWW3_9FUNG|nr:uncharacterized protein SmJEL517_g03321 [Synchytrium microbalum]TPX33830.1 hypothetical protein SmJEL517_g03321 [Synchytrium microbalum]
MGDVTAIANTNAGILSIGGPSKQAFYIPSSTFQPIPIQPFDYKKYLSCSNFKEQVYCISDNVSTLYKFDATTLQLVPQVPLSRDPAPSYGNVQVFSAGSGMYLYGGLDPPLLSSLDVKTGDVKPLMTLNMLSRRTGFSVAAMSPQEVLVMFGQSGEGGYPIPIEDAIFKFSLTTNSFSPVVTTGNAPPPGSQYPTCVSSRNTVFVATNDATGMPMVYELNATTMAWTSFPKPTGQYAPQSGTRIGVACLPGNYLVMIFDPPAVYTLDYVSRQFVPPGTVMGGVGGGVVNPSPAGGLVSPTMMATPTSSVKPIATAPNVVTSPTRAGSAILSATLSGFSPAPMLPPGVPTPVISQPSALMAGSVLITSPALLRFSPASSIKPSIHASTTSSATPKVVVPLLPVSRANVPNPILIAVGGVAAFTVLVTIAVFLMVYLNRRRENEENNQQRGEGWEGFTYQAPPSTARDTPPSNTRGTGDSNNGYGGYNSNRDTLQEEVMASPHQIVEGYMGPQQPLHIVGDPPPQPQYPQTVDAGMILGQYPQAVEGAYAPTRQIGPTEYGVAEVGAPFLREVGGSQRRRKVPSVPLHSTPPPVYVTPLTGTPPIYVTPATGSSTDLTTVVPAGGNEEGESSGKQ